MAPIVVIVGRPNVGKSTLFNRLSRSRGALVDNRPGVTRDRLYAPITYNDAPLTIVDTGGFEDLGQDPLVAKVKDQVNMAVSEADHVIFMVDGRQGIMPGDQELADQLRKNKKKVLVAVNKVDGPEHENLIHEFHTLGLETPYPISASHGYGIRAMMDDLLEDLPKQRAEEDENRIRVAILGRPNTGKSSLINRILGANRLLVSDLPGTTRDSVDTPFTWRDRSYLLIDTAGIRRKGRVKEKIEKFSVIKALKSLDRCHVAVVIIDAYEGVLDQDAHIYGYAFEKGKAIILAVNKWDLIKDDTQKITALENSIDRQLKFVSFAPRINLSALTGQRVMKLFDKIEQAYEQFSRRISTPEVNKALKKIMEKHPPSRVGRGRLRFLYATQPRTRPPTFICFVNKPDAVHFSYKRFMINQIRMQFHLDFTPIKLIFRESRS